jgi:hypothetical protein
MLQLMSKPLPDCVMGEECNDFYITNGDKSIAVRRADFWVNATHILRTAGWPRAEMPTFTRQNGKGNIWSTWFEFCPSGTPSQ